MLLPIDNMKIIFLIYTVYLYDRQSGIRNLMKAHIAKKHLLKQQAPVFLGRHCVLGGVWYRIDEVTIVADNDIFPL